MNVDQRRGSERRYVNAASRCSNVFIRSPNAKLKVAAIIRNAGERTTTAICRPPRCWKTSKTASRDDRDAAEMPVAALASINQSATGYSVRSCG